MLPSEDGPGDPTAASEADFLGLAVTCFLTINIINQIEHVISGLGDGSSGKVLTAQILGHGGWLHTCFAPVLGKGDRCE